jgi:DNA-binding NarL/FixJ family response regulator
MSKHLNIILVEASFVVCDGLDEIFRKNGLNCQLSQAGSLDDVKLLLTKSKCDIVIINPQAVLNNEAMLDIVKNQYNHIKWIAFVYAYFDARILSLFDAVINITDTPETIIATVSKLNPNLQDTASQDILSDREIDVLKLVATGMANKEIADKLNISTHTVISHRKNISQKTGIKSVSGLTIYAVVKNLVSIETL